MRAVLARLRPSRDARDATVRLAGPAAIVARVAATAAAVAIAALGAAVPPAPPATAAPARQATPIPPLACTWDKLPVSATQGVYFMATAYDTLHHKLYSYGGVDQSGDLVNIVGALDVSDADPAKAGFQPVVPSGSRVERYGTAGAFRPKGDDSAIYWIGGADDSGGATTEVQIFNIKANTWRKVTPAGSQKRAFHAAAYDPVHDVVVVHGGTKQCKVVDVQPTDDCEGDNLRTQFLAIDANGDVSWVNGPQGGPSQILGLTMVYDSVRKRMIAYAGTSDGNLATDRVWVLRLHDADLANATWSNLNVTGTAPQGRFFHSAAYHADRDMMVLYGGVTQMPFSNRENALDDTWALRFTGATTAVWEKIDASILDRVGASMEYSPKHKVPIIFGGRGQYRTGTQAVNRDYFALPCGVAPTPTATPRPATPPPPGGTSPKVCTLIRNRVPAAVINAAVANPNGVRGFGEPCNQSLPPDPFSNPPKRYLSLQNIGIPWDTLGNPLIYKCGCP